MRGILSGGNWKILKVTSGRSRPNCEGRNSTARKAQENQRLNINLLHFSHTESLARNAPSRSRLRCPFRAATVRERLPRLDWISHDRLLLPTSNQANRTYYSGDRRRWGRGAATAGGLRSDRRATAAAGRPRAH